MNAEISETIQATILGLGMQIPEIPAQRKFVSAECHAHSNAHKPPETVVLMLEYKFSQQSEIKMRHLPAVYRFKRYGR